MNDPFGSMQNFLGGFRNFMGDPIKAILAKKMNIPQEYMNNPDDIIQYLMNTGKLSQAQYNEFNKTAKQIQKDPNFKKFMGIQ